MAGVLSFNSKKTPEKDKGRREAALMFKQGDSCPICGNGYLERKEIDEVFEYKGHKVIYPNYVVYHCSTCDESIVDKKSMRESTKFIRDFQRSVDGFLTSDKIASIRKNLGFTQDQMGELLGGGKKAFARYEGGQVLQSKPMDNLLRILDEFPFTICALTKSMDTKKYEKFYNVVSTFSNAPASLTYNISPAADYGVRYQKNLIMG